MIGSGRETLKRSHDISIVKRVSREELRDAGYPSLFFFGWQAVNHEHGRSRGGIFTRGLLVKTADVWRQEHASRIQDININHILRFHHHYSALQEYFASFIRL